MKWDEWSYIEKDLSLLSDTLQGSGRDHPFCRRAHRSNLVRERHTSCQALPTWRGLLGEIHRTNLGDMRRSLQRSTAMVVHGRNIHFGWCPTTTGSRGSRVQVDQCHLARGHSRPDSTRTQCIACGNNHEWGEKTESTASDLFSTVQISTRRSRICWDPWNRSRRKWKIISKRNGRFFHASISFPTKNWWKSSVCHDNRTSFRRIWKNSLTTSNPSV